MNKNKNLTLLVGIVACVIFLFTVTVYVIYHIDYETPEEKADVKELEDKIEFLTEAFAMNHINESDPDWECKKWVGIVELAKQDYPNFVEETLLMAEKKCGFDVNEITS